MSVFKDLKSAYDWQKELGEVAHSVVVMDQTFGPQRYSYLPCFYGEMGDYVSAEYWSEM